MLSEYLLKEKALPLSLLLPNLDWLLSPRPQLTILLTTHTSISGWGLALNGRMTQNHDAAPD